MIYNILAWWSEDPELVARFGDGLGKHEIEEELTDVQVVDLIMKYGRASIENSETEPGKRLLIFQNDYD